MIIDKAIVFSNERAVSEKNGITYLPIYYCMFIQKRQPDETVILPELKPL